MITVVISVHAYYICINVYDVFGFTQVIMGDRPAAERACKEPNPIIDGRKANVNLAILGAKPRGNLQPGKIMILLYPRWMVYRHLHRGRLRPFFNILLITNELWKLGCIRKQRACGWNGGRGLVQRYCLLSVDMMYRSRIAWLWKRASSNDCCSFLTPTPGDCRKLILKTVRTRDVDDTRRDDRWYNISSVKEKSEMDEEKERTRSGEWDSKPHKSRTRVANA